MKQRERGEPMWSFPTGSDLLRDAKDIADTSIRIFHSHIDNAALIGLSVKGSFYFYPPSAVVGVLRYRVHNRRHCLLDIPQKCG